MFVPNFPVHGDHACTGKPAQHGTGQDNFHLHILQQQDENFSEIIAVASPVANIPD